MPLPTKLIAPIPLVFLPLIIGCEWKDTEILTIGPYTQTCQGFIQQECFLECNEQQQWEFFYESIQGFNFEPGFIYKLKVRLEDRGTKIQDVGRYAYHLVEVLSKEKVSKEILTARTIRAGSPCVKQCGYNIKDREASGQECCEEGAGIDDPGGKGTPLKPFDDGRREVERKSSTWSKVSGNWRKRKATIPI